MFLFDEQQDVTFDLAPRRRLLAGPRQRRPATLPPGSQVSSFIVHGDKIGANATPVELRRLLHLRRPDRRGHQERRQPDRNDSRVGIPGDGTDFGARYEAGGFERQFEGTGNETGEDSADGHTVEFDLEVTSGADEVRVLTGTVPPQSTITGTKFHDQNRERHPRSARARGSRTGRSAPMRTTSDGTLAAAEDTLADEDTTDAYGAYQLNL